MNAGLEMMAYHPVEAAITRFALGLAEGSEINDLDLWNDQGLLPAGTIHLEATDGGGGSRDVDLAASNALARIVLAGFEGSLPTFFSRDSEGQLMTSRPARKRRTKSVRAFPIALFGINWASSGPGIDWPERYHLGWLPGFDVWVVTGSQDSADMYGYCDRTMGHFAHGVDPIAAACAVIQKDWQHQRDSWGQGQWEEVMGGGRVEFDVIGAMAAEVWAEKEEETEEEA